MLRKAYFSVKHFSLNPLRTRISLEYHQNIIQDYVLYFLFPLKTRPYQSMCIRFANQPLRVACFPLQLYTSFTAELKSAALMLASKTQNVNHVHYSRELAQHKSNQKLNTVLSAVIQRWSKLMHVLGTFLAAQQFMITPTSQFISKSKYYTV